MVSLSETSTLIKCESYLVLEAMRSLSAELATSMLAMLAI